MMCPIGIMSLMWSVITATGVGVWAISDEALTRAVWTPRCQGRLAGGRAEDGERISCAGTRPENSADRVTVETGVVMSEARRWLRR